MEPLPLSSYRRPVRPLKAYKHFRKLIANKEDTAQVYHIVEALSGNSLVKCYNEFITTPEGKQRYQERRYLPPLLDDHDSLMQMPAGSFGRSYVEFMQREGLTAQGLVDELSQYKDDTDNPMGEDLLWYAERRRDTHDMLHVLTGYGRDALGEATVLAFTHSQHRDPGIIFIAYGAALEIKKSAPKGAPVIKCIREGRRLGKEAAKIINQDIMALLPLPLEEVREQLGIKRPETYHLIHQMMRDHGIDPYEVVGAQAA